jgi:flavodoxin I
MKTLVVFETLHGNTDKIARAIAGGLSGEVVVKNVTTASAPEVEKIDLLVIGSATQGGRPMKGTQAFLDSLSESNMQGLKTAAFDTRLPTTFVKLFGWAAKKIADSLSKKGANLLVEPEGFFVMSTKGPEKAGELERAVEWGKKVQQAAGR